jgi:predicted kinase
MDLEEHQQAGLANLLLNVYLEESGDFDGLRVLTFYKVYRAMVRAKVAALRAGQQVAGEQQRCWEEVGTYLDYAKSALELRCPSLVMTHGVSGSGKTYQTEPLLHQPGVIRIRSDVERKRMEELNGAARVACKPGEGLYSAANKNAVYEHLRQLAEVVLRAGWTVVLDATFLLAENRLPFFQLATQLHVPIKILHFEAAEKVLRARLQERGQRGDDASDAGWDVLQAQLRAYQPLSTSELAVCTTVERLQRELAGASPT